MRSKKFAATLLWIILSLMLLYLLMMYSVTDEYYGVESIAYNDLDSYLNAKKTAAFFYHEDCPHCNEMMPLYDAMSSDFPQIQFVSISADEGSIPYEENIGAYPTIRIYEEKDIKGDIIGKIDEEDLRKELNKYTDEIRDTLLHRLLRYFKNLNKKKQSGQEFNEQKSDKDAPETTTTTPTPEATTTPEENPGTTQEATTPTTPEATTPTTPEATTTPEENTGTTTPEATTPEAPGENTGTTTPQPTTPQPTPSVDENPVPPIGLGRYQR